MGMRNSQALLERQIVFLIEGADSEAEVIEKLLVFPKDWIMAHELGRKARESTLAEALAGSGLFAALDQEKQALVTATQSLNKGWRAYQAFAEAVNWDACACQLQHQMVVRGERFFTNYALFWLAGLGLCLAHQPVMMFSLSALQSFWPWGWLLGALFSGCFAFVCRTWPNHPIVSTLVGLRSGRCALNRLRDLARSAIDGQTDGQLIDEDKNALRASFAIGTVHKERKARGHDLLDIAKLRMTDCFLRRQRVFWGVFFVYLGWVLTRFV